MRIGMILDESFPPDSRVENEALVLIEEGHNVVLLCFDFTGSQPEFDRMLGIDIVRLRIPRLIYKLSALAYTFPIFHLYLKPEISKFIESYQIEILHIHNIQVARAVFWANKKYKLPVILDLHENRPEIMKYYRHVSNFSGKMLIDPKKWRRFEHEFIREADNTIVVTEEAKKYYLEELEIGERKITVVPNSVRLDFYKNPKLDIDLIERFSKSFTILYLGDTGLRRGIETLIKAIPLLINDIPNVKLVIVGKNNTDDILFKLVGELGIDKYVDFEGWKDLSEFPAYIHESDIGVSPLHRNLHHDTTYANKVFQYMAFGKPVVVSDCEAQAKLIKKYDCGLVFKDRNHEDLAKKILILYEDKMIYNRMSKNAMNSIENELNFETISKDLRKLYAY